MKLKFFILLNCAFLFLNSCKKETVSKQNQSSNPLNDTTTINNGGSSNTGSTAIDSLPYALVDYDYDIYKDTLQKRLSRYILLDLPITDTIFFYIPYKEGNGKKYKSKTFSDFSNIQGKNNLKITLVSGKLNVGSGFFKLGITGGRYSSDGLNNSYNVGVSSFSIDFRLYDLMSSGFFIDQSKLPLNSYLNLKLQPHGYSVGKLGKSVSDIDGNIYNTVHIGKQRWFQSILKVTKYNDGSKLQTTTSFGDTIPLAGVGYWNNYQYNWYAVDKLSNGNKNVCPTGWHVPTFNDWVTLVDFLGDRAAYKLQARDTTLEISSFFVTSDYVGEIGRLWTSTPYNDYNGVNCGVLSNQLLSTKSNKGAASKTKGNYIRCIED